MLRRPQYAAPMPWGPPASPTRSVWPRVLAVAAAVGLFAAIWFRAGLLALALALALGFLLRRRSDKGRAAIELVAAGVLALLLAGSPAPKAPAVPSVKAPARVAADQTGQLAEARCGVVNLYTQIAQGFPALPDATPCPAPAKRGGRR